MYLDFLIEVPEVPGKITYRVKKETSYVMYEYDRTYDAEKQITYPKRATIGKLSSKDNKLMQPNQNFLKYFSDVELPDENNRTERSSLLHVGTNIVINKIIEEYNLREVLGEYFTEKDMGLFIDLAVYSIIAENNAAQYYPDYAYNHALFTEDMKMYSDSKVSEFMNTMDRDMSVRFLNSWNKQRDHRERIYISYDSTNKNCQAGDIEIVEYGHAKDDEGKPIFNYSMAYDTTNKEPLFYEEYPGSITDVSQLEYMIGKAKGYGYRRIGFILDRGYFSKKNLDYLEECKYNFVIMLKGMANLVKDLVKKNKGTFEHKRINNIDEYGVYGITIKRKMYESDKKERYFHLYHSINKENIQRTEVEEKIRQMKRYLEEKCNSKIVFPKSMEKYFYLHYDKDGETFLFPEEKADVIEEELLLSGYFVIITSEKMSAEDAINLYKSRDVSEKLFRGDKSYLGNNSLRVHSTESAKAKIFIEFVAMIIRCKIYTCLKEHMKDMKKRPNYMTVPAAIKELEKIEMIRQLDNIYRLDHAITAKQKNILKAFGIDERYIKNKVTELSDKLRRGVK